MRCILIKFFAKNIVYRLQYYGIFCVGDIGKGVNTYNASYNVTCKLQCIYDKMHVIVQKNLIIPHHYSSVFVNPLY